VVCPATEIVAGFSFRRAVSFTTFANSSRNGTKPSSRVSGTESSNLSPSARPVPPSRDGTNFPFSVYPAERTLSARSRLWRDRIVSSPFSIGFDDLRILLSSRLRQTEFPILDSPFSILH